MANRYWVDGDGDWSDATNHWSDSSGGTPNASFLPTSSDDVFIDANSDDSNGLYITVESLAVCNNFDCSGLDVGGDIDISTSSYSLSIHGNFINNSSGYLDFMYGYNCFFILAGSGTFTSNGGDVGGSWKVDCGSNTYTIADDLTSVSMGIYLTNGTLDTNGKAIHIGNFYTKAGTKTLIMTSNTLKCVSWVNEVPTGFTFTSGTGTIELTSTSANTPTFYLYYATTFYNLTITGVDNDEQAVFVSGNNTITNTFTIAGYNATNRRIRIRSTVFGTNRTFTANGTTTISNADFHYITGAGTFGWDLSAISGGSGDCGGNSGITFTSVKSIYWYSGTGNWSDTSKWFTATNGGGTGGQFPLPQDLAYLDANSFSGAATITFDCFSMPYRTDFSAIDELVTIERSSTLGNIYFFGSFYSSANVTCNTGVFKIWLMGLTIEHSWDLKGETFGSGYETGDKESKVKLLSDWKVSGSGNFRGAFDMNDFNFICLTVNFQQSNYTHYLGSGTLEMTTISGTAFGRAASAPIEFETSTLKFNPASGSNDIYISLWTNHTMYNIWFSGSHTGRFIMQTGASYYVPAYSGNADFNNFRIDAGRTVCCYATSQISAVTYTLNGSLGNLITLYSMTVGDEFTFYKLTPYDDVNCTYLDLKDCHANAGGNDVNTVLYANITKVNTVAIASVEAVNTVDNYNFYATNSTDNGNTDGWIIT